MALSLVCSRIATAVFCFSFLRASAKARLRWRGFSNSFTFSVKLSEASLLRLSLLTQEPRVELLPLCRQAIVLRHSRRAVGAK